MLNLSLISKWEKCLEMVLCCLLMEPLKISPESPRTLQLFYVWTQHQQLSSKESKESMVSSDPATKEEEGSLDQGKEMAVTSREKETAMYTFSSQRFFIPSRHSSAQGRKNMLDA
ncbi:UNVERIFIED_CONTAM: hypothetical protein K2H54_033768 [Gekko kuhli]